MDKRYQVFVSSTYADLKKERQHVIQTLMEMDCIPAGMELFPAADEEQLEFIKRIIDDCDYYLLIIGGRYGSLTSEDISYTEQEYDYAIEKGLKVIAFLLKDIEAIPVNKTDSDPNLKQKLISFRDKVSNNRLVKFWQQAEDLPGLVALSLSKTIKMYPAVGWVRANTVASAEILSEVNALQKENQLLHERLTSIESIEYPLEIHNLAKLDEPFKVHFGYEHPYDQDNYIEWEENFTWQEIFAILSPYIENNILEQYILAGLSQGLADIADASSLSCIKEIDFQTIIFQFRALGLIAISRDENNVRPWHLTPEGKKLMFELRTIKSSEFLDSDWSFIRNICYLTWCQATLCFKLWHLHDMSRFNNSSLLFSVF